MFEQFVLTRLKCVCNLGRFVRRFHFLAYCFRTGRVCKGVHFGASHSGIIFLALVFRTGGFGGNVILINAHQNDVLRVCILE